MFFFMNLIGKALISALFTHLPGVPVHAAEFEVLDKLSVDGYSVLRGSADIPGGSFAVGTSTFVIKSGKIGIGTSVPGSKLSVVDTASTNIDINPSSGGNGRISSISMGATFSSGWGGADTGTRQAARLVAAGDGTGAWDGLHLRFETNQTDAVSWTERMRIMGYTGNVGIGTTAPAYKLDVQGTLGAQNRFYVTYPTTNVIDDSTSNSPYSEVNADSFHTSGLGMGQAWLQGSYIDTNTGLHLGYGSAGGQISYPVYIGNSLYVDGTGTSYILGNLGIGTGSPAAKLDVAGLVQASSASFTTTGAGAYNAGLRVSSSAYLATSGGNVGIGTTAPITKLDVNGGINIPADNFLSFGTTAGAPVGITGSDGGGTLRFHTASVNRLQIANEGVTVIGTLTTTGSVGIGTANPNLATLQVAGSIMATTGLNVTGAGGFFNAANKFGLDQNGATARFYASGADATTAGTYEFHVIASDGTPDTIAMAINNLGNVGIGTANPGAKLDVAGVAAVDYLRVDPQDGVNEGGELQLIGAGSFGTIQLDNFAGNIRFHTFAAGKQFQLVGGTLYADGTGANNYFAGNVGIGTATPGTKLEVNGAISGFGIVPIGSIIAWHKSLSGTPALPSGWAECNGQTLSDAGSPYNGQVIPDLNGGARFLRGAAASGTMQADAFQGHWHQTMYSINRNVNGTYDTRLSNTAENSIDSDKARAPVTDGANGAPRTASETRPINMSVVWIMRVK